MIVNLKFLDKYIFFNFLEKNIFNLMYNIIFNIYKRFFFNYLIFRERELVFSIMKYGRDVTKI